MSKEVKVSGVRIKVGDVDIEMSLKQAKELYEMLEDLFGKEVRYVRDIQYVPYYPRPYPWRDWTVTWGNTSTSDGLQENTTITYCATS